MKRHRNQLKDRTALILIKGRHQANTYCGEDQLSTNSHCLDR
jgi:hypothetical protein